jgi:hypothetical protein
MKLVTSTNYSRRKTANHPARTFRPDMETKVYGGGAAFQHCFVLDTPPNSPRPENGAITTPFFTPWEGFVYSMIPHRMPSPVPPTSKSLSTSSMPPPEVAYPSIGLLDDLLYTNDEK